MKVSYTHINTLRKKTFPTPKRLQADVLEVEKIVPVLNYALSYEDVIKHRVMTRYVRVEAEIHALLTFALNGGEQLRLTLRPLYSLG